MPKGQYGSTSQSAFYGDFLKVSQEDAPPLTYPRKRRKRRAAVGKPGGVVMISQNGDPVFDESKLSPTDAQIMEEVRNMAMLWFRGFVKADTALATIRDLVS